MYKSLLTFVGFIFSIGSVFSDVPHVEEKKQGAYRFTRSIDKLTSDQELVSPPAGASKNEPIVSGYKIKYLYEIDDQVYFQYFPFTKDTILNKQYVEGGKTFILPEDQFNQLTEPIYSWYKGFGVGAYTVPYRLRGVLTETGYDFESALSLSTNLVVGFGSSKSPNSWIDFSLGLGLTSDSMHSHIFIL
ncbi:MAG: hypothetical protein Kapaf2KO_19230 [Candidatus Kapaibacteriales bacterium]